MGQAVNGTVNLSLVSWQGLATGTIGVTALQTQLANMGFSVGSVSQLLSANMTLAQLYQATATALTLAGDTANASLFNALRIAATSSVQMTLGGLIQVAQGSDTAALSSSLNLFQLVTGSALLINGTNTLALSNVGITVPGVTSTALSLKVTELPQTYIGPVGGSVSTGQVELVVTPKLDLNVSWASTCCGSPTTCRYASPWPGPPGRSPPPPAPASPSAPTPRRSSAPPSRPPSGCRSSACTLVDVGITTLTPSVNGPAVTPLLRLPLRVRTARRSPSTPGRSPSACSRLTTYTVGTVTVLNAFQLALLGLTGNGIAVCGGRGPARPPRQRRLRTSSPRFSPPSASTSAGPTSPP